jgi:hypothetical protein
MREIIFESRIFKEPDFIDERKYASKTYQAIKNKTLIRQPCEICGNLEVFAHHEIYSDYLNVRWLCRSHHLRLHAIFRQLNPRILIKT